MSYEKVTHQNLKRRLFAFMRKKDVLTKASLLSMEYPRPAFPSGAANLVKNAKQKPSKIQIHQMRWNL